VTVSRVPSVEDVNETLPATDICAVTFCVDEHVVRVAAKIDACHVPSIRGRESAERRRGTKCDEHPLEIIVERHGKIPDGVDHRPRRRFFVDGKVDHRNSHRFRDVDEYPVGLAIELEAFRVSWQVEFGNLAFFGSIDHCDGAVAKSNQYAAFPNVDTYIVGIIAQFDAANLLEVAGLVYAD